MTTGPPPPGNDQASRALTAVLTEYQFVAGMIPFYRRVELTALAGTGLVVSGVVAALAAAWVPALLLLIEDVALTRIARASAYIAEQLHPLVARLTGEQQALAYELAFAGPQTKRLPSWAGRSRRTVRFMVTSSPFLIAMALGTLTLAAAGVAVQTRWWTIVIGSAATLLAGACATYGLTLTIRHEGRDRVKGDPAGSPAATATSR
jgi:hypothetical protein